VEMVGPGVPIALVGTAPMASRWKPTLVGLVDLALAGQTILRVEAAVDLLLTVLEVMVDLAIAALQSAAWVVMLLLVLVLGAAVEARE